MNGTGESAKLLIITLEKNGETKELKLKFKHVNQQIHAAKELTKWNRKGWQLKDLSGNSEHMASMKRLLGNYKTGDSVPIKQIMKETRLKVLPDVLKKKLENDDIGAVKKNWENSLDAATKKLDDIEK